jgi:hypothetical protein
MANLLRMYPSNAFAMYNDSLSFGTVRASIGPGNGSTRDRPPIGTGSNNDRPLLDQSDNLAFWPTSSAQKSLKPKWLKITRAKMAQLGSTSTEVGPPIGTREPTQTPLCAPLKRKIVTTLFLGKTKRFNFGFQSRSTRFSGCGYDATRFLGFAC